MPFLERSALLRRLEDLLAESVSGCGRLACIAGEAGAGKSTLAQALASAARDRVRVLWGACEDLSTPQPLGPLHDLARRGGWSDLIASEAKSQMALFNDVLEELAARPTLVVLEDLHWADDATLDLVRFLGRRIHDLAIMLVVTARDDASEAQTRLRRALVDVPPDVSCRLEVPRLSEAAVRELARPYAQDGGKIFSLTGGNAFLVTEVLRSGQECPATVRDALLVRAEALSRGAREALNAASIFPRRVEAWLLGAVCSMRDDDVSECVASGMLTADHGFLMFRHEIARQAIEGAMPEAVRAGLNKRALQALRKRAPAATARLVHHALAAGDADAVCELAPRAAEEAARAGAHPQAARHFAAALSCADHLAAERRADLYERSAFELQLIGRVGEALDARRKALDLRRAGGDDLAVGDGLRWISRLHYNLGDRDSAEACAKAAIEALEGLGQGPQLAMAYANFALIKSLNDDRAPAIAWAARTLELAARLGRRDIEADALATLGVAKQWVDLAGGRADFERSLAIALELNCEELAARIYTNASCVELNAREGARAHRMLEAGLAYCRERDLETWGGYMKGWLAELLVREGKWSEAETIALKVMATPGASPLLRFPSASALARIRTRTGLGDADPLIRDLTFGAEPQRLLIYAPILGERAWIEDVGHAAALDLLARAAPIAAAVGNIWAAGEIAYWRRKLGDSVDGAVHMAAPHRALLSHDWETAQAAWAELGAPYEQALALLEGDEAATNRGLIMLDALGARATAERSRRELRQRGVRSIARGPRPSTRANLAGLTRREVDVLRLVDSGLSNAEIASRLGVSPKTVDHHVSAILAKLQSATRGEAAARARKAGLLENGRD
jgi:DNA-binding CsgD family transcriptional regulator